MQSYSFVKRRLIDVMSSCGCENNINVPTSITADTSDILLSDVHSVIMVSDISDHLPFFVFLPNIKTVLPKTPPTLYRKINDTFKSFQYLLHEEDWTDVYNESNPNLSYTIFVERFINIYNTAFRLVK